MWGGGSGSSSDNGNSFSGVVNSGQLMDRRIDHIFQAINTLSHRITDLESIRDASDAKVEPVEPIDFGDLEWRLKQMQQDMKFMWNRLADLEAARDEKVEPYDVMDSFRATKPDAGEPANRYFVDCLKENAKLIEENDVLSYQYDAMREETVRCKELLAKKNQEIDILKHRIEFFQKMAHDFELENKDAKWYKEQAIKKCIDIVEQIKNDPLTAGDGKRWMVAICEDIQRAIKNEFGVGE